MFVHLMMKLVAGAISGVLVGFSLGLVGGGGSVLAVVTLQEIVRMRRFTHSAVAYLRIILGKIIEYAAITITPPTAGTPSMADVNSLKRLGFRQPCDAISLAKGTGISAH